MKGLTAVRVYGHAGTTSWSDQLADSIKVNSTLLINYWSYCDPAEADQSVFES